MREAASGASCFCLGGLADFAPAQNRHPPPSATGTSAVTNDSGPAARLVISVPSTAASVSTAPTAVSAIAIGPIFSPLRRAVSTCFCQVLASPTASTSGRVFFMACNITCAPSRRAGVSQPST